MVLATTHHNLRFMHDGTPAQFSIVVPSHIHATCPGRWIRRGRPVAWFQRSPDHNPLNIFFWGHLKSLAYDTPTAIVEDLTAQIVIASDDLASTTEIFERVQ
ncbi:uncharacterized protein TNCV_3540671 [Trichonephila clavipes]|nr:uncharacterized protein TNCV_3540671 [Trichonephila clavipes]